MKRNTTLVFVLLIFLFPTVSMSYVSFQSNTLQAIPDPLVYSAAAYYNGKIFLIGGFNIYSNPVSSVYVYSNGSWYLGPSLPFALMSAGAVVCNNKLYVVGGYNYSSVFGGILEYIGNGWRVITTSMPYPVYGAIVFGYNNQIYVIGGSNATGNSLNPPLRYIQVYNLKTGTWQIIGESPIPLLYSAYYFNGSVLFVVGGFVAPAQLTTLAYKYFPENNSWVPLGSLPGPSGGGALGYYNGYIFLVGGLYFNEGHYEGGVVLYYHNGTWKNAGVRERIPTMFSSYVQVHNTLVIMGGYGPGNVISNAMQTVSIYLPPPKPQIKSVVSGNETVTIKWYGTNASGYYIKYWSNLTGTKTINVGNVLSYTLSGLINGVTYYIQIIPYNAQGNGTPSDIITATPASVPNPPIIKVKLGNNNATVFWIDTFDGGYPILGYYLIVGNDTKNLDGNVSSYTLTNLTAGKLYTVGIIAYNKLGNSSISTISFVAMAKPNISVEVKNKLNGFLISWNTTTFSGKVKYLLTVSQNNKILINVSLTNTSYFVSVPFGLYNVSLEAISQVGVTKLNFPVIYYIPPSTPQVNPTVYLNNTVYLNWTKSIGAVYYLIYYNGNLVGNVTGTNFSFNISYGTNLIKVYAANPYYRSVPYTLNITSHSIVESNGTVILVDVPKVPVSQAATPTLNSSDPISLKSAIIVILVFILALLSVLVLLKERRDYNYW